MLPDPFCQVKKPMRLDRLHLYRNADANMGKYQGLGTISGTSIKISRLYHASSALDR